MDGRTVTDPGHGPASGSVLALDIGGTKLAAGLVEPDTGTITRFAMVPTPRGDAEQVWRAITGLVDMLVGGGLVTRESHPTDRRATLVTLTARGKKLTAMLKRDKHEDGERWRS